MTHEAIAIFDGEVLRLENPLDLVANTRYRITIAPVALEDSEEQNAWTFLNTLAGTVEAPPDWSVEHDHYLYGTPKRQHGSGQ